MPRQPANVLNQIFSECGEEIAPKYPWDWAKFGFEPNVLQALQAAIYGSPDRVIDVNGREARWLPHILQWLQVLHFVADGSCNPFGAPTPSSSPSEARKLLDDMTTTENSFSAILNNYGFKKRMDPGVDLKKSFSLTLDRHDFEMLMLAGAGLAGSKIPHLHLQNELETRDYVSPSAALHALQPVHIHTLSMLRTMSEKTTDIKPSLHRHLKARPEQRTDVTTLHLSGDFRAWNTPYVVRSRAGLGAFLAAFAVSEELSIQFWGTYETGYRELVGHLPPSLRRLSMGSLTMHDLGTLVDGLPLLEELRVTSIVQQADQVASTAIMDAPAEWLLVPEDAEPASVAADRLSPVFAVMTKFQPNLARFHINLEPRGSKGTTCQLAAEEQFRAHFADPRILPSLQECSITLPYFVGHSETDQLACQSLAFHAVDGGREFSCSSTLQPPAPSPKALVLAHFEKQRDFLAAKEARQPAERRAANKAALIEIVVLLLFVLLLVGFVVWLVRAIRADLSRTAAAS